MSRQRTDPALIRALMDYHAEIAALFRSGKLKGKMKLLMIQRCRSVGIAFVTYCRRKKDSK